MSEENINCTNSGADNKLNRSGVFTRRYRFVDSPASTTSPLHQQLPPQLEKQLSPSNASNLIGLSMESSISECITKSGDDEFNESSPSSDNESSTAAVEHYPISTSHQQRKIEVPKLKGIPPSIFKPSPANHQPHQHHHHHQQSHNSFSARVQSASSRSTSYASTKGTTSNPSTYYTRSLATTRNTESKASTTTAPYPCASSSKYHGERSVDSSLSSSTATTTTFQFQTGTIHSPPKKPQSSSATTTTTSGRKSCNSIQISWRDAKQTLRNSFSSGMYNTPRSTTQKYNSFISSEEPIQDCCANDDSLIMSTPRLGTLVYSSDSSTNNSIVTASPIPNFQSYNEVVNNIEQDNDLESVESYQTEKTLNEGTQCWDTSDLFLRTGMAREQQLSPNSEFLVNSTYMKLKMSSPRLFEKLVKQIEIEGPTERLPNSPIVKEIERFNLKKEQPKKPLFYPLLPPVEATIPATPSFDKPGSNERRENKIRLRVEKELIRSHQLNEFRDRQRMLYKEDLEISREQQIAQYEMFKKQKLKDLKKKMAGSPFLIDMEAHAKKTEREIRRNARIKEKLQIMENRKRDDLRKCELIERIIEKSREDVHTTRRNIIDYEREMRVVMGKSTRLNK